MKYYKTIPVTPTTLPPIGKAIFTLNSEGYKNICTILNKDNKWYIYNDEIYDYVECSSHNMPVSWLEELPPDEFVNGEEVEVSDDEEKWYKGKFIGIDTSNEYCFAAVIEDSIISWKYCRRPQPKPDFQKEIDELIARAKEASVELKFTIK